MDSRVRYNKNGDVYFEGPDAVHMFRAAMLISAIGLLAKGIKPARGWTLTKALAAASEYSGKKYKRSESQQACKDLRIWVQTMKAALPSETME